ncbi:FAD-dependent oxidoreductase, partial [Streptomyces lasiicapitis]|uniref:FAD-dependent oxidoreductase n=1 Tax=Streptomyces lasiicapitis TaxID=1923961 RepID=UPI0036CBD01A
MSTAAHLRARGVRVRVFGEPMVSWDAHMPAGMLLKSTPVASSIDAPQRGHTLVDYCDAAGLPRLITDEDIIPVETFVGYGRWFQEKLVPGLERVRVVSVDQRQAGGFEVKLDSGEQFAARAVVVATGLSGLARGAPGRRAAAAARALAAGARPPRPPPPPPPPLRGPQRE